MILSQSGIFTKAQADIIDFGGDHCFFFTTDEEAVAFSLVSDFYFSFNWADNTIHASSITARAVKRRCEEGGPH